MNAVPRHCPYCQNQGCIICHTQRLAHVQIDSNVAEAKEFWRKFLLSVGQNPDEIQLQDTTLKLIIAAIKHGKDVVRGDDLKEIDDDPYPPCRFSMLEFERITLIPQRAEEPPWVSRSKRSVMLIRDQDE